MKVIVDRTSINRKIYIRADYIREALGISSDHERQLRVRGRTGRFWKCRFMNNEYYYDYDTIPNRAPKYYQEQLPAMVDLIRPSERMNENDKHQLLCEKMRKEVNKKDMGSDIDFYSKITGKIDDALKLAKSKAFLDTMVYIAKNDNHILMGFDKISQIYDVAISIITSDELKGMNMTNALSMRRRVYQYMELATVFQGDALLFKRRMSLIHQNRGNNNASKVRKNMIVDTSTGEVMNYSYHETIMYSLYMNIGSANKMYKKSLYGEYIEILRSINIDDPMSLSTFNRWTNRWDNRALMSLERDGKKHFNNAYMPYVSANGVLMSNSLWGADGSSTKLMYRDGDKIRSLMCYRIADICSRKILGYSFYENNKQGENEDTILRAIYMAYKNAECFGVELITDNGGGAGTQEFKNKMEMLFKKHTNIIPGNSQQNPTENIIKSMNNFGRKYNNWGGSSWDAKKIQNRSNTDHLKDSLPTREEAYSQAIEWVESWNNTKGNDGQTPNERYELSKNPDAKNPDAFYIRYVFGNKTKLDISSMRGFVNIEIHGKMLQYTIPNYEDSMEILAKATGWKSSVDVIVRHDGEYADLYTLDDKFILTCERTKKSHKTIAEITEDSWNNFQDLKERKNSFVHRAQEMTAEIQQLNDHINYDLMTSTKANVKEDYNNMIDQLVNQEIDQEMVIPTPKIKKSIAEQASDDLFFS